MNGNPKITKFQEADILERNKKIDLRLVSAQTNLESQLKELGVEVKPEFKLEPPLGRGKMRFFSRNF